MFPLHTGLRIEAGAVVWPVSTDPLHHWVEPRLQSPDHRRVWLDLNLEP